MYGGAFGIGPAALGDLVASGIYNGQQDGASLVVWDVQVFYTGTAPSTGAVVDFDIIHGAQSGAFDYQVEPVQPATSQGRAIKSFAWGFKDPNNNEAGKPFLNPDIPVNGYQWVHTWPLCAIMPGDSIVAYSDANAYTTWGATWLFEVVPGGI
jgi:hypothetical protein